MIRASGQVPCHKRLQPSMSLALFSHQHTLQLRWALSAFMQTEVHSVSVCWIFIFAARMAGQANQNCSYAFIQAYIYCLSFLGSICLHSARSGVSMRVQPLQQKCITLQSAMQSSTQFIHQTIPGRPWYPMQITLCIPVSLCQQSPLWRSADAKRTWCNHLLNHVD